MKLTADIVRLDQSYSLDTNTVDNYLVLSISNGDIGYSVRALINEEDASRIISDSIGESEREVATGVSDIMPETESAATVHWPSLDERYLSSEVREVLMGTPGLPETMELDTFTELVREVSSRLSSAQPTQAAPTVVPHLATAPRRSVSKDEAGNPIVPGGLVDRDPGEVADEDGVPQL